MPEPFASTLLGVWVFIKSSMSALIAGVIGAAVSLKFAPEMSTWEKVTTVATGACMAQFITDPLSAYFSFQVYRDSIGFLIGLFGLSLCAAILKVVKETNLSQVLTDFLSKKVG